MASSMQYFRHIRSFLVVFGYQVPWLSVFGHTIIDFLNAWKLKTPYIVFVKSAFGCACFYLLKILIYP